jgi:hypothetical protein
MKIGLMYSDRCNFQCRHCMVDSKIDNYSVATEQTVHRFLEIIEHNQPEQVCIVGGEPLLFLDDIELLVQRIRKYCDNVLIYSNGTFLQDENKRQRVKALGVQVRISKTAFHKDFWTPALEALINDCDYWKIEALDKDIKIFPRGRALSNKVYQNQSCPCSLITENYSGSYHSNRILIMPNGSVNIWCPCMSLELANIFEDKLITHDLLQQRECKLRDYLKEVNMFHDNMLFMCNEVCNRFKVTKRGIYRDNELMKEFINVSK